MSSSRIDAAMAAAVTAHQGQVRDGEHALPYVTHPVEVLMLARQIGGVVQENFLIAALLHDTVEEGGMTLEQIGADFGEEVGSLVKELTREEPTEAQTQGLTKDEIWELRAQMLLKEIERMSPAAQALKLADRLANVRDAKRTKTGKKLQRYLRQTKRILEVVPENVNRPLWKAIREELQ